MVLFPTGSEIDQSDSDPLLVQWRAIPPEKTKTDIHSEAVDSTHFQFVVQLNK